jgi:hypothetical protein
MGGSRGRGGCVGALSERGESNGGAGLREAVSPPPREVRGLPPGARLEARRRRARAPAGLVAVTVRCPPTAGRLVVRSGLRRQAGGRRPSESSGGAGRPGSGQVGAPRARGSGPPAPPFPPHCPTSVASTCRNGFKLSGARSVPRRARSSAPSFADLASEPRHGSGISAGLCRLAAWKTGRHSIRWWTSCRSPSSRRRDGTSSTSDRLPIPYGGPSKPRQWMMSRRPTTTWLQFGRDEQSAPRAKPRPTTRSNGCSARRSEPPGRMGQASPKEAPPPRPANTRLARGATSTSGRARPLFGPSAVSTGTLLHHCNLHRGRRPSRHGGLAAPPTKNPGLKTGWHLLTPFLIPCKPKGVRSAASRG